MQASRAIPGKWRESFWGGFEFGGAGQGDRTPGRWSGAKTLFLTSLSFSIPGTDSEGATLRERRLSAVRRPTCLMVSRSWGSRCFILDTTMRPRGPGVGPLLTNYGIFSLSLILPNKGSVLPLPGAGQRHCAYHLLPTWRNSAKRWRKEERAALTTEPRLLKCCSCHSRPRQATRQFSFSVNQRQ